MFAEKRNGKKRKDDGSGVYFYKNVVFFVFVEMHADRNKTMTWKKYDIF